jgi:cytoskeleton protein RodZ
MPEIGQTLRETRMRNRVDITEVEAGTKIRAKYLRALENEEWDLLPGPTFVKTFLRSYADYLGLDSRLLVEEYKQRFEGPTQVELTPFAPRGGGRRERRRRPFVGPAIAVAVGVIALLAALYALGTWGDNGGSNGSPNAIEPTATATRTPARKKKPKPAAPRRVTLQIVPTGTVNVCLVDASGRKLIDNVDLQPGKRTKRYRGRSFRVSFGNGAARLRAGGRTIDVPDRSTPVGYELRAGKRPRELPEARRPTCL